MPLRVPSAITAARFSLLVSPITRARISKPRFYTSRFETRLVLVRHRVKLLLRRVLQTVERPRKRSRYLETVVSRRLRATIVDFVRSVRSIDSRNPKGLDFAGAIMHSQVSCSFQFVIRESCSSSVTVSKRTCLVAKGFSEVGADFRGTIFARRYVGQPRAASHWLPYRVSPSFTPHSTAYLRSSLPCTQLCNENNVARLPKRRWARDGVP